MSKYYMTFNANRIVKFGDAQFQFEPIEQFAGNWCGVLKIDDEAKIAIWDKNLPLTASHEITELEYLNQLKKKMVFMKSSVNSLVRQSLIPVNPMGAKAAIKTPTSRSIAIEPDLPSINEAIQVGRAPYVDPITRTVPPKQHYAKSWQG